MLNNSVLNNSEIPILTIERKLPPVDDRLEFKTEDWFRFISPTLNKSTIWHLNTLLSFSEHVIDQWIGEKENYRQTRTTLAAKMCFITVGTKYSLFEKYTIEKYEIISEKMHGKSSNYKLKYV